MIAILVTITGFVLLFVLLAGNSVRVWRRVARMYPDQPFSADVTSRTMSGHIGCTYGVVSGWLRVEVSDTGLRISVPNVLRFILPPFVISWSAIQSCVAARYAFNPRGARLELSGWPYAIHLWSSLWRDGHLPKVIQERWHKCAIAI